jgi:hypothetical protein
MSHDHSHSHGHDHYDGADPSDHQHDHSDDVTPAMQNHIYSEIDFSKITTLNESEPHTGSAIVQKTWAQRLDAAPELRSDVDEQLLMTIPFTAQIRLHSILIRTSMAEDAPKTLKLYVNREDLDFATAADLSSTQTLELAQSNDVQEYPVKRALFNTTRSLTLFFEDNWGHGEVDVTCLAYLGFKGDKISASREPVSVMYEAAANPADHKIKGTAVSMGRQIGGE